MDGLRQLEGAKMLPSHEMYARDAGRSHAMPRVTPTGAHTVD